MNRVAAQTAGDRKKNLVIELEKKVAMLEAKGWLLSRLRLECIGVVLRSG